MTPPPLIEGGRKVMFAGLIALALMKGLSLACTAFATRWLFTNINADTPLPITALWLLAGAGLLLSGAGIAFRSVGENFGQAYLLAVRLAQYDHASRTAPSDLENRRLGYLVFRFVGDLTALKDWAARGLPMLVEGAIMMPAMILVLFLLDPGFGYIACLFAVLALAGLLSGARPLLAAHRLHRSLRAKFSADMTERVPLAPELLALGRQKTEKRMIENGSAKLAAAAVKRTVLAEVLRVWPEALAGFAAAALVLHGVAGNLDIGTIAASLAALGLAVRPARNLALVMNRYSAYRAAHQNLKAHLARPVIPEVVATNQLEPGPLRLEFVAFGIDGNVPLTLSLPAGERVSLPPTIAIDSLYKAIAAQENRHEGTIRINGLDISEIAPSFIKRRIARVTFNPIILRGSLRRTITLAFKGRPADPVILSRLADAWLADLLTGLGGLDTRLPEGGRNLTLADRVAVSVLQSAIRRPGLLLVDSGAELFLPGLTQWLHRQVATVIHGGTQADHPDPEIKTK